jgi:hypothetical protein
VQTGTMSEHPRCMTLAPHAWQWCMRMKTKA